MDERWKGGRSSLETRRFMRFYALLRWGKESLTFRPILWLPFLSNAGPSSALRKKDLIGVRGMNREKCGVRTAKNRNDWLGVFPGAEGMALGVFSRCISRGMGWESPPDHVRTAPAFSSFAAGRRSSILTVRPSPSKTAP